ncbi:MAG: lipoate--protein ligase family protein [Anaerolineae bacterium]
MSERTLALHNVGGAPWLETQALYHAQADLGYAALNIIWPEQPYVCIGRFQDATTDVDLDECARRALPVVRREVGGGAVFLDGRQVFYQLVLPLAWLGSSYDYRTLFALGLDGVVLALNRMGIEATGRGTNDVVVGRRKISGNGAGEVGEAAVVVGNILVDFDYATMAAVLRVPDEKFRDKAYRSMKENLVTMQDLRPIGNEALAEVMAAAFTETLRPRFDLAPASAVPAAVRQHVPAVAARLVDTGWLHSVRRRREQRSVRIRQGLELRENVWKAGGGLIRCQSAVEDGRVAWVSFSGDFFIHPHAALAELEVALTGCAAEGLHAVATGFLARADVAMPGVTPEDIERAVLGGR